MRSEASGEIGEKVFSGNYHISMAAATKKRERNTLPQQEKRAFY